MHDSKAVCILEKNCCSLCGNMCIKCVVEHNRKELPSLSVMQYNIDK